MLKRRIDDQSYCFEESSQQSVEKVRSFKSRRLFENESPSIIVPRFQKGLIISTFEKDLIACASLPVTKQLKEYEILVQNEYVGLNHVDWKSKKYRFNIYSFPWVNGRECSGIVIKQGPQVDKKKFPIFSEVFLASTSYRDLKTSTFQEYTVFDSRLVWRIPQHKLPTGLVQNKFGLEFAAGIGVALVTAGSAISTIVDLTVEVQKNNDKAQNIAIWGGSSSVGLYVIQLAKACKKFDKIVIISSSKHKDYLKELGATHVIDRFQPAERICEEIADLCPEGVNYGIDVISKETATVLSKILEHGNTETKKLVCIVGLPEGTTECVRKNLKTKLIIETVNIKKFHEDIKFGSWFVSYTSKLFGTDQLKPIESLKVFKSLGSFGEGIKNGLKELEDKGASAEKFVASL